MRSILILITLIASLWAKDTGNLSFYLMKDGTPLANQSVVIFKKTRSSILNAPANFKKHAEFTTDEDGYLNSVLRVGVYQLQVIAKEEGKAQAFVKKPFTITKDKESQIIVSLKEDDSVAFEDSESAIAAKVASDENLTVKENGDVLVKLISSEDQKVVKGAHIFVQGMSLDVVTDAKGSVSFTLPEGEHTISIIHTNFSAQTIKLSVVANEVVNKSYELSPASMELEEFVVLAPQVQGSVAALTAEKRNASAIADIVGSEQMSKKGDSNAASALKRVAGITLVDGKYIYVRGLGERYSSVEMNSMPLPSPDPTKRVIPLDLFPSSVIGSLKVQKTASADVPGNFGGGYIDVRTKEDVSEDYLKLSAGIKAHSSALDDSLGTYYNGAGDGIDSSILNNGAVVVGQPLPRFDTQNFTEQELIDMSKALAQRDLNTYQDDVPLGFKGSAEYSKSFDINDEHSIGILANYSYSKSAKTITEDYYSYSIDGSGNIDPTPENEGQNFRTSTNIKQGGILNLSYNYSDSFDVKYTKLYLVDEEEQTRITAGTLGSDSDLQRFYYLEQQTRTLDLDQISGTWKYHLLTDMKLDFGAEFAVADLNQPGNIKYKYIDYTGLGDSYELKTQSTQNLIFHNIESEDEVVSGYLKNNADLNLFSEKDNLDIGLVVTEKTRESRASKFYFDSRTQNIDANDLYSDPDSIINKYVTETTALYDDMGFVVKTLFQPSDYYDATYSEAAVYAKTLLNPMENLEISLGLRKVDVTQSIDDYLEDRQTGLITTQRSTLKVDKLLPSVDAKLVLSKKDQLRFAYSQSYIMPDFREFSSSGYDHPEEVATVVGNPNLVSSDVMNFDFRYEHYYSTSESISGAVFYKSIDNPIEDVTLPTTSLPIYSYVNTSHADLLGFELDGYTKLGFIDDYLEYFYMSGNFSYTYSQVTLTPEQEAQYTSNTRTLQGLSPIVVNLSLGYDNEDGRLINIAYNKMSKRIRKVGLQNGSQEYPDQEETPPHILDFTWQERIYKDMDLKFKARNLLNDEIVWEEGSNVTKRYTVGRSFELAMSYRY